jgi:hypothetical protein
MRIYFTLIVAIWILSSCSKNKELNTLQIELDAFDTVVINNSFNVFLQEDSIYQIEIIGQKDFVEKTDYFIKNGTLTIDNSKKFKWTQPKANKVELIIHAPIFSEVHVNETCDLRTKGPITSENFGLVMAGKMNQANLELNCHTFYYWDHFPCGGKVTLYGNAEVLKLWNYGLMSIDAKDLKANYGIVDNSSKGSCDINIKQNLEYSIYGLGDINLFGNPTNITNKGETNSGRLKIQ